MRYRILGTSGLRVSEIGLGALSFGTNWGSGGVDAAAARKIFRAYREAGGNFIDTADRYQTGESEQILSQLLSRDREEIVLASKFGMAQAPGRGPNSGGHHPKHLRQALDASLARLGVEYLDLYYI